jgi:16S rRNA (cytidine1402-2'-O)-methyltransferase
VTGGRLVVVATPIGNLGDLSPRAVAALEQADAIVCEDTRRTGRLLEHAGIAKHRLIVANEHREAGAAEEVGRLLDQGALVAVVTDAGTPGISDPGERLVRAAIRGGHTVETVPGPSAAIAALVVSGLPTDRFVIEGFLPRKGKDRASRLAELAGERRTIVLYEAPHRLGRTLDDLRIALGPERAVVVARELTKLHEEVWRGTLGEAVDRTTVVEPRGEHVLVLAGAPLPDAPSDDEILGALGDRAALGERRRDAIDRVASTLGVSRRRVYALAHAKDGRVDAPDGIAKGTRR